jgi:RNA polymerase sigma-70 factor (ECF subfamily)
MVAVRGQGRVRLSAVGPAPATVTERDRWLLERAAAGDADAFEALLEPRLQRLLRMAVAITRNASDAQDAVQEASVAAWRQLPRLRERGSFDAWLAQILVNACRGILRRRKRSSVVEIPVDEVLIAVEGGPASPDRAEDVVEVEAIRRAFGRIDPVHRALLVMHYVEERPLAEIGRITGAPVGTVKWRLSNARRALDRALEDERR